jgi:nucleoside 2-deoxyribosyltransferase
MTLSRLKGSTCYVAGGIQYIPDLGVDWRAKAEQELRSIGIGVFNPMDKAIEFANEDKHTQNYLNQLKNKAQSTTIESERVEIYEEIAKIMRAIVRADLRMVDLSSFLLVCIDPSKHTAGTYAEMTQAFMQRKPVVCFCEQGIESIPLWWWGHGDHRMFFSSLDESLDYIKHIHEDENIEHFKRWKFFDYSKIYNNIEL